VTGADGGPIEVEGRPAVTIADVVRFARERGVLDQLGLVTGAPGGELPQSVVAQAGDEAEAAGGPPPPWEKTVGVLVRHASRSPLERRGDPGSPRAASSPRSRSRSRRASRPRSPATSRRRPRSNRGERSACRRPPSAWAAPSAGSGSARRTPPTPCRSCDSVTARSASTPTTCGHGLAGDGCRPSTRSRSRD
jgi:hypothetical protein